MNPATLPQQIKVPRAFVLITASIMLFVASAIQAQTFTVIHTFGGADGYVPFAGLTMDRAGNLYGTTRSGGSFINPPYCQVYAEIGCGTVFRLSQHNSVWQLATIFSFDGPDGAYPFTPVTIGTNGILYGTTSVGGACQYSPYGCGVVFKLTPPGRSIVSASLSSWTEAVVHVFTGNDDGGPDPGGLIFDSAGNMYGPSFWGGSTGNNGVLFEFSPSGNNWVENVLYTFQGGTDGWGPHDIVADAGFDHLFGATHGGGNTGCDLTGCGTIYELTRMGSVWTKTTLHVFTDGTDGAWPDAAPILDSAGNLYGTTPGAFASTGTVWEMSPSADGWTFTTLHIFAGCTNCGPYGGVTMDAAGNLYGTTFTGGSLGRGNVFKLSLVDGQWTYTDLHDFTGGSDGGSPHGNVLLDSDGNLYGTTTQGGLYGLTGVVWEITGAASSSSGAPHLPAR
jgi:uncharacterized repeat protein (TIGR03803 family)